MIVSLMVLGAATFSYAAQTETYTASVTLSTGGITEMSIALRSLTGATINGNNITWTSATTNDKNKMWSVADTYLVISSTITEFTGVIRIYTDNTRAGVSPRYIITGDTTTSSAGLISADGKRSVPMCWRLINSTDTISTIKSDLNIYEFPETVGNNTFVHLCNKPGATGNYFPCYLWMLDKNNTTSAANKEYSTIKNIDFVS
jgi:hypothetical protein